ncbi:MAG: hypothetical protein V1709_03635 [Planctomycetota bacterium]
MKIDKIMITCAIVFIALLNCFPLNADYYGYGDEKKTTLSLRYGGYAFSDPVNDSGYGDDATAISFDLTLSGDNPGISWRFALEKLSSSANAYVDANNHATADLGIAGPSVAVVFHNDRNKKVGVYGGLGLGFYNVAEKGSAVLAGTPFIIDGDGSSTGINLFGGINVALSDSFSLGLEYFNRNLKVDMEDPGGASENINYGGKSLFLTLGFSF